MKVLADKYLYRLKELMPEEAELDLYDPDKGFPDEAHYYDALLIRTVTKINEQTLPESGKLTFIGSATAGFDHVDLGYLASCGISFARSEGCNANAVAEYVLTAMHKWADVRGENLSTKKVGVVGCGNTGGRVSEYLKNLGVQTVLYDPPKEQREERFTSSDKNELLHSDILTFHTPLTKSGSHSTAHICSEEWLEHGFSLILNTSRGGVVDEEALLHYREKGSLTDYILDVWEGEPIFNDEVAKNAFITTPHIAGYSKEAKWKASEIVVNKMCDHFGVKNSGNSFELRSNPDGLPARSASFAEFLWQHSNLNVYDSAFKSLIGLDDREKAHRFAKLRSETETRFEFKAMLNAYENRDRLPDEVSIFTDSGQSSDGST